VASFLFKRRSLRGTSRPSTSLYNTTSITQSIRGVRKNLEQFGARFAPKQAILATMFGLFVMFDDVRNCSPVRIVRIVRIVRKG